MRRAKPDGKLLTRRQLPALLAVPSAVASQTAPSGSEQELAAARETIHHNTEALSQFNLPPETEPAFQFKA